jgi:hypothetical protein
MKGRSTRVVRPSGQTDIYQDDPDKGIHYAVEVDHDLGLVKIDQFSPAGRYTEAIYNAEAWSRIEDKRS